MDKLSARRCSHGFCPLSLLETIVTKNWNNDKKALNFLFVLVTFVFRNVILDSNIISNYVKNTVIRFSCIVIFQTLEMKIDKFANSVDPDEVAHHEPPHLDLHCLPTVSL